MHKGLAVPGWMGLVPVSGALSGSGTLAKQAPACGWMGRRIAGSGAKHSWMGLILILLAGVCAQATAQERLHVRGYLQATPVRIAADLPEPFGSSTWMDYRLQNRLNMRWEASPTVTLHAQMRTRLFAGDLVNDFPMYADGIDTDNGLVDLSWLIVRQDNWLLHYIPDRLYGEWDHHNWNVRIGRQRVNWGVTMTTNPNDLFNIYSFYDFDYPERPGSDAVRVQRFLGFGSRLEVAVNPGRSASETVAAALYAFNVRGYDMQVIGGYYRERFTAGAGWAGNLREAGFKGEVMFYGPSEQSTVPSNGPSPLHGAGVPGQVGNVAHAQAGAADPFAAHRNSTQFIAALALDYMFTNGLFLVTEVLYNHAGGREQFSLLGEELSPDNPSFSRYQLSAHASVAFHPLMNGSLAAIAYPDERALFVSPSLTWSVATDLDLQVLAQLFAGAEDSVFSDAGHVIMASLTWNF